MLQSDRLSWDETWMRVAMVMGGRSSCVRRHIGAVIVSITNRVVATGYNGPPAGYKLECASACPRALYGDGGQSYRNCISVHAEANALMFCDRRDREGGTIYVVEAPCWDCAKLIANSGLKRIVIHSLANQEHRQPQDSIRILEQSGIVVDRPSDSAPTT